MKVAHEGTSSSARQLAKTYRVAIDAVHAAVKLPAVLVVLACVALLLTRSLLVVGAAPQLEPVDQSAQCSTQEQRSAEHDIEPVQDQIDPTGVNEIPVREACGEELYTSPLPQVGDASPTSHCDRAPPRSVA